MQAQRKTFGTLICQTEDWLMLSDEAKRVVKTNSNALAELSHNTIRIRLREPFDK